LFKKAELPLIYVLTVMLAKAWLTWSKAGTAKRFRACCLVLQPGHAEIVTNSLAGGKEQRRHNLSVRGADNHMAIASAIATAKKQDKNIYLMIKDCFNGKPLFDSGA
jgi:hypothetical protein